MSDTAPPRSPRPNHGHSKSANPISQIDGVKPQQRRPNRARNTPGRNHASQRAELFDSETAYLSSGDNEIPNGPRSSRKTRHTDFQPLGNHVGSGVTENPGPPYYASSLTDSEAFQPHRASVTPGKPQTAYAGATFHASPAPSSLPIPKFFSKSVPTSTDQSEPPSSPGLSEESSSSSPTPTPSPSRAPIAVPPRSEESPLDMLFKADREEKAKRQSPGVSGNSGMASTAAFSPPSFPSKASPADRAIMKHKYSESPRGMFPMELDGHAPGSQGPRPVSMLSNSRSSTAPSLIPGSETAPRPVNPQAARDILLALSQKKPGQSTPPRIVDHVAPPSSSRDQTPSPFVECKADIRSASSVRTPSGGMVLPSDPAHYYGNRNLSPLFKAAKQDSAKRNSGLRAELGEDPAFLPPTGSLPVQGTSNNLAPNTVSGNYPANAVQADNRRRSSVPHNPPHTRAPADRGRRGGRGRGAPSRPAPSRPDSYPSSTCETPPASKPKSAMAFMPSSVQANYHRSPPVEATTLEQDLKRLLNIGTVSGSISGVR